MNPAFSVIFFTVVSGMGYGLLFLLGALFALNPVSIGRNEALLALGVGATFVAAGLLASTLHLGQPQRAWRAFSQWRSSWLSREGVASVVSFAPIFTLAWCLWRGADASLLRGFGALLAALAIVTVVCTAKIYTSLKTIPAWHNAYVLPGYLLLGLLGGAVWLLALHTPFAILGFTPHRGFTMIDLRLCEVLSLAIVSLSLFGCVLKLSYWRQIDAAHPVSTLESATGLGRFGSVRSVEAPHTEENYLTQEMGFVLARKHGKRLRAICLILLGPVPVVMALGVLLWPTFLGTFGMQLEFVMLLAFTLVAALSVTASLFVERWLFFAEAWHVVMLYYGGAQPHRA
ncbi:MAG TPA: DmsC/YnfH family molybdoenzyme membrane anchor subunit [Rudaea sp.]|nr:DmsC/YnfH family molybdoenzyme membrane anchor subunit [Rudaea sp.]